MTKSAFILKKKELFAQGLLWVSPWVSLKNKTSGLIFQHCWCRSIYCQCVMEIVVALYTGVAPN